MLLVRAAAKLYATRERHRRLGMIQRITVLDKYDSKMSKKGAGKRIIDVCPDQRRLESANVCKSDLQPSEHRRDVQVIRLGTTEQVELLSLLFWLLAS